MIDVFLGSVWLALSEDVIISDQLWINVYKSFYKSTSFHLQNLPRNYHIFTFSSVLKFSTDSFVYINTYTAKRKCWWSIRHTFNGAASPKCKEVNNKWKTGLNVSPTANSLTPWHHHTSCLRPQTEVPKTFERHSKKSIQDPLWTFFYVALLMLLSTSSPITTSVFWVWGMCSLSGEDMDIILSACVFTFTENKQFPYR